MVKINYTFRKITLDNVEFIFKLKGFKMVY